MLSKKEIGIGLIGLGFVGEQAHLSAFRKIPGAKLAAVADMDVQRAKKAAEKAQIKAAYSSHEELLKDPNVEAVVIAVPTFLHHKFAIDSVRAGRHVLCEMPLAPSVKEAREIVDEAKRAGVIFMPDLNFRFTPNYVKAKEMIDKGIIGKPAVAYYREFIPADILAQQWPANSWAWDEAKTGGGPGFTLSVWSIDLLRWLLGAEIVKTHSVSEDIVLPKLGGTKGYNSLSLLEFSNGAIGNLQFSGLGRQAVSVSRLEVFGSDTNSLTATGNDRLTLYGEEPDEQNWIFKERGPRVWGHYQADQHFVEMILNKQEPVMTGEDAIKAQEAAASIRKPKL